MDIILEALSYNFIQRALLGGILISVTCSFLGVFLVLRNYSLIGDGLAHINFATIAIALLLGFSPLMFSIPLTVGASFMIYKLNSSKKLEGDTAIALVSSFSVALGVIISSLANGFNIDLFSYLFGSILLITTSELYISVGVCLTLIVIMVFYYNDLLSLTYDEDFSKVMGIKAAFLNNLTLIITAVAISVGIRLVGTMLISSLIVFPSATSIHLARSFKGMIFYSLAVGVISIVSGIIISYAIDIPSGATIVVINSILFAGSFLIKRR